ncbi:ISAs1 family transposase [Vibrio furnissii]|uniref:ISAs1 family transposase n=1 Tax=Vibrio furnissii TaxID=29494 RepID=UPI0020C1973D|nr:ISAs1 family transposase [Vibrio furnissii]
MLSDPRQSKKVSYDFFEVLFQVVVSVLCGYKTWDDIEEFGHLNIEWFRQYGGFVNGVPSHDTLARIVSLIDPDEFSLCFTRWCNEVRKEHELADHHIAIDGKALRGTYDKSKNKCLVQMVNAYSIDSRLVLGQVKTDSKSNEITAIPELLKLIAVKNKVISLDAMGCQRSIAKQITERGGDYLLAVKENQKALHALFQEHFPFSKMSEYEAQSIELEESGQRGRRTVRTYTVVPFTEEFGDFAVDWSELKSLCIAMTYKQEGDEIAGTLGIRYFISSKALTPEEFGQLCRGHWQIESMHWWLDSVMREDDCRIMLKQAAQNLSRIRQMCLNMIKLYPEKGTLKRRQMRCALDTSYREKILFGG